MEGKVEDYIGQTGRESILLRPEIYLGTKHRNPRDYWIYEYGKITKQTLDTPVALKTVFTEILANAIDASSEGVKGGMKVGPVIIKMTNTTITIINGGKTMPIEKKDYPVEGTKTTRKMWIPEACFGRLNTSSHYEEDEKETIGRNGLGGKCTNIFSHEFTLDICNAVSGKRYTQKWSNHMEKVHKPEITDPYDGKENIFTIKYKLDLGLFDLKKYRGEEACIYRSLCYFASYACHHRGIGISFNGEVFNVDRDNFLKSLGIDVDENTLMMEWSETKKGSKKEKNYTPRYDVLIVNTPHSGSCLTFVNGAPVEDGGTLTDAVIKVFTTPILNKIKTDGVKTTKDHILKHVTIIVRADIESPDYDGQKKSKLETPCVITKKVSFNSIAKWDVIRIMKNDQYVRMAKKTDGVKRADILIPGARGANWAGRGKKSRECALISTEGKSGASLADILVSMVKDGKDTIGILPEKGKGRVVRKCNLETECKNVELNKKKKMLGLKTEYTYESERELNTLNYGQYMIFADIDDDGFHITSITLDFFVMRFPGLINSGFISYPLFPYIIAYVKSKELPFYSKAEYEDWARQHPEVKHRYEILKGLGSYTKEQIADFLEAPKFCQFVLDGRGERRMKLAFDNSKEYREKRKEWTKTDEIHDYSVYESEERWDPALKVMKTVYFEPVHRFMDTKARSYAITNSSRSIPSIDGLKTSQRDIVHAMILRWPTGKNIPVKLIQFSSYCAEKTHYAYGEGSIPETVKAMSLGYVGKNNLPYMVIKGGTGSREGGGPDCPAARYLSVYPNWWIPYVFRKEDGPLLRMWQEDGKDVKPYLFRPLISMALVNGANGMGTAWSTKIPRHHPMDVVRWHLEKLRGKVPTPLIPWYRHFKGSIRIVDRKLKKEEEEKEQKQEEEEEEKKEDKDKKEEEDHIVVEGEVGKNVKTSAIYKVEGNTIHITELPIGIWTGKYVEGLKKHMVNGKYFTSVIDKSTDDIDITVEAKDMSEITRNLMKFNTFIPLTNLVLLGKDGKPHRYVDIEEIIEEYHQIKIQDYSKRIGYIIFQLKESMRMASLRYNFITEIINKTIVIKNKTDEEVRAQLEPKGYPIIFKKMPISSMTKKGLDKLKRDLEQYETQLNEFGSITPEELFKKELKEFAKAYSENETE